MFWAYIYMFVFFFFVESGVWSLVLKTFSKKEAKKEANNNSNDNVLACERVHPLAESFAFVNPCVHGKCLLNVATPHRSINFSNLLDCVHVFHIEFRLSFQFHAHTHSLQNLCIHTADRCYLTNITYVRNTTHSYTTNTQIGRVFRFGQTQKLAWIPNKIARQHRKNTEREREKKNTKTKQMTLEHVHILGSTGITHIFRDTCVCVCAELHELFGISV